jgi:hypothetical protein
LVILAGALACCEKDSAPPVPARPPAPAEEPIDGERAASLAGASLAPPPAPPRRPPAPQPHPRGSAGDDEPHKRAKLEPLLANARDCVP